MSWVLHNTYIIPNPGNSSLTLTPIPWMNDWQCCQNHGTCIYKFWIIQRTRYRIHSGETLLSKETTRCSFPVQVQDLVELSYRWKLWIFKYPEDRLWPKEVTVGAGGSFHLWQSFQQLCLHLFIQLSFWITVRRSWIHVSSLKKLVDTEKSSLSFLVSVYLNNARCCYVFFKMKYVP